jgi:hypothetical protein
MGMEVTTVFNHFDEIGRKLEAALVALVKDNAEHTAKDAHDAAPERDGDLKASIHVEDSSNKYEKSVVAGTGLPDGRAVYNEYGTGQRGETGNHPAPADDTNLSYRGDWAGMAPHPYMTPAAEKNRQKFLDDAADLEKRLK